MDMYSIFKLYTNLDKLKIYFDSFDPFPSWLFASHCQSKLIFSLWKSWIFLLSSCETALVLESMKSRKSTLYEWKTKQRIEPFSSSKRGDCIFIVIFHSLLEIKSKWSFNYWWGSKWNGRNSPGKFFAINLYKNLSC